MPYELSEDEALIRKVVREFAQEQVGLEAAHGRDRHDRFPWEALQAAAALGLTSLALAEDEGGAGAGPTAMALALDEVAQVDPDLAAVLGVHNALALPLLRHAAPAVRSARYKAAAEGQVVAVAATEEAYGSDKSRVGTVARPDGDGFRISGQKVWVMAAEGAAGFLVLAHVPDEGPTWFDVPADADGLVLGRNEALLGLRASGIRAVYLDVDVDAERRVGDAGAGQALYQEALPWHQVATAAALNGCLAGAFSAAVDFAASRVQFGKPIGSYQAVSGSVAEVELRLAASRALTLEAAACLPAGGTAAAVAAARAKESAAASAVWMTRTAIRIQGGTGFMREGGTERFARCARALQFVAEPSVAAHDLMKRNTLDIAFGPTP